METNNKQEQKKASKNGKGSDTLSDKELFKQMMQEQYQPTYDIPGHEGSQLLCTSRDLQYKYREMCTVSVSTVAEVMLELGYTFTFVNGSPIWELYQRLK